MDGPDANQSEIGVLGLDPTGRNVVYRLAELSFRVAACGWTGQPALEPLEGLEGSLRVAASIPELMESLREPRTLLVFSDAQTPMNSVLEPLLAHLKIGDLVIDAGDSYFKDTVRNKSRLAERCVQFMGAGLGGGEKGAREGAIVMAGGGPEARRQARPLLEAMAATVGRQPCVCWFESAAAAHFARMVHAGIDNALLQLLSETFDLLQGALSLAEDELRDLAGAWRGGLLNGYLMEICGRASRQTLADALASVRDGALGRRLVQSSWELESLMPTMEATHGMERVGSAERLRALAGAAFRHPAGQFPDDPGGALDTLHGGLQAAMMITYAQGLALLSAASKQFGFGFNLPEVARSWRGCAPLRAALLTEIAAAFEATPDLPGLLSDADISERVMASQENLRHVVWRAYELNFVVPALLASLDYLDSDRNAWLPVNLMQPLRPPFSHGLSPVGQTDYQYDYD